jgi:hypothetical protein
MGWLNGGELALPLNTVLLLLHYVISQYVDGVRK